MLCGHLMLTPGFHEKFAAATIHAAGGNAKMVGRPHEMRILASRH